MEYVSDLLDQIVMTSNHTDQLVDGINQTLNDAMNSFATAIPVPAIIDTTLTEIRSGGNLTLESATDLAGSVELFLFQSYGYHVDSYNQEGVDKLGNIISTSYLYFFISAGAALIILAILLWLGMKKKSPAEYGSIAVRCLVGTGLCLLATMYAASDSEPWVAFVNSGWTLPTVVLCFFSGTPEPLLHLTKCQETWRLITLVLIMDKVLAVCLVARDNRKRGDRRSSANTQNRY